MLIKKHTAITISNSPEHIWKYVHDPKNWTASNPEEHFGLQFFNEENRPKTGVEFRQKESVAGIYADLRGHIVYANPSRLLVWRGIATYRLLGGLFRIRIPEGGVVQIKKTDNGARFSHDVYMDFPRTVFGRLAYIWFVKVLDGPEAVYGHTYRELEFFKEQLDQENKVGKSK